MNIFGGRKKETAETKTFKKGKVTIFKSGKSQQAKEKKLMTENKLIPRPFRPDSFRELYESCEPFFATVNQIAVDVGGLGFSVQLKDEIKENETEKEKISKFIARVNKKQSLFDIVNLVLLDWGILGMGFIEVVRNLKGEVTELHNIRAIDMWLHESKKLWANIVDRDIKWFKEYGDETIYRADTGKEGKSIKFDERANEVIVFITHYDSKGCYGIPNILPAIASVICQKEIKDYNLSVFRNYAIPAYAVLLTGEWEDGADTTIIDFLDNKIKGSENQNKTIALQIPDEGDIKFEKLAATEREGSYRAYSEALEATIFLAYSMPPERVGKSIKGSLGGSNIREHTEIYKQSVTEPLRTKMSNIINFQIIADGMKIESYTFAFKELDTRDLKADVEMYIKLIERASMTPNEVRQKIGGMKTYVGGDKFYIAANLIEAGEAEMTKQDDVEMEIVSQISKLREDIAGIENK